MLFSKEELDLFLENTRQDNLGSKNLEVVVKKEFSLWLSSLVSELKETISNNSLLDPALKDERVKRAEFDFDYFKNTYFKHYLTIDGSCEFHGYLCELFNTITKDKKESKTAIAAPRGHAKTTFVSIMFVLWCIVYQKKHFIVSISDSVELVQGVLESVKAELEENPNLKTDFESACGIGKLWRIGEIVTSNGIKVEAFGTGTRIRGIRHGVHRPDLVILDDLENDTNVRSKLQRDRLEAWIDEAVLNLGGLGGKLTVLYIGTILHNDSVLARKLKNPFWDSIKFKSIIEFPSNLHLWSKWQAIILTDGLKSADEFYEKNKKAMDEGAKVLWQEALSLYDLMKKRASNKASFNKEQQNEPSLDETVFSSYQTFDEMPLCDAYYIGIDPSLGKAKGDYFSVAILGLYQDKFYAKVKMTKLKPEVMADRIIIEAVNILNLNRPLKMAIETVQFQEFFKDYIEKKASELGIYLPIIPIKNTVAKELRIDSLAPAINNGLILIDKNSHIFIDELDTYPSSAHDDGLDSLEFAWRIAKVPNFDYEKVNQFMEKHNAKKSFLKRIFNR